MAPSGTLLVLLHSLHGYSVHIELKNELSIYGKLVEITANGNLVLETVEQHHPNGRIQKMDVLYIAGKMILMVHLPSDLHLETHLAKHERLKKYAQQKYSRCKLKQ